MTTPQVDFDETNSMVIHTTGDVEFTAEEYGSSAAVGVLCTAAIDRNGSIESIDSLPATVLIYGKEIRKCGLCVCVCVHTCVHVCVCVSVCCDNCQLFCLCNTTVCLNFHSPSTLPYLPPPFPPSPSSPLLPPVPPSVSLSLTKSPASVGDDVTITCIASGGIPSDYSFMWFKGSAMEPLAGVAVDETMSQLSFSDIQPDDFDTYTCHVNNSVRHMNKSISLTEAGMCKHGRHMHGCCMELSGVCPRYSINILNAQFECVSVSTPLYTATSVQQASLCQGYPLYTPCLLQCVNGICSLLNVII